ncbi:MAG: tol-pal system protein YbgF [Woeseiaceae bacterium]|nr:tol-pal system protein YbgF [Woeseiaceae bacterium]
MPISRTFLFAALVLTSACEMMQPREDPVAIQLAEIERRLAALERIVASGSLVELTVQVDELQRLTAELQGRTETLEYEAENTASRQRDLYVDLDDRLQTLERSLQTVNVLDGGSLAPGQLPVPSGSDRDNYQAAFELLKEQRYQEAAMAFQQFLVSFPDSQLADNALYWLAESYYVTDRFEDALTQFQNVISRFPRSRKVPDALLKIGYSNYELERWESARGALRRVQDDYPDTTAARLAEQRLNRMDDEGH